MHLKRQIIYFGGEVLNETFNMESFYNFKDNNITVKEDDCT